MAGGIRKTPAGSWRAYWRDPAGRQTSKMFRTKREAAAFLAQMTTAASTGGYVSPHAGRVLFGEHVRQWMQSWNNEKTTHARDASIMRTPHDHPVGHLATREDRPHGHADLDHRPVRASGVARLAARRPAVDLAQKAFNRPSTAAGGSESTGPLSLSWSLSGGWFDPSIAHGRTAWSEALVLFAAAGAGIAINSGRPEAAGHRLRPRRPVHVHGERRRRHRLGGRHHGQPSHRHHPGR
ncbi:hypothetical protein GCM10010464_54600 [Pseudonocardia yunnanensis]